MKLRRMLLAVVLTGALVGVAYVGQTSAPAGVRMVTAAEKFLDSLNKDKRDKPTFAFDDKERTNWAFTPQQDKEKRPTRKGLPLAEMSAEQKKTALDLLRAGTSPEGAKKATTIMSLEDILHDLEKNGAMVRNHGWYFFTVFGTPSKSGKWGWRVEGHHLALNFVIDGGKVVSATPAFFGANPATVLDDRRKGLRTLPEAEDLAKELYKSLDDDQKKVARQDKLFPEVQEKKAAPQVGDPVGLPAGRMTPGQRTVLMKLLQAYADRMPPDVAAHEMSQV